MGDLSGMIARLRGLASYNETAAELAVAEVKKAVAQRAAAGQDPDGQTWKPKADGSRPLARASEQIAVTAEGDVVTARISAPLTFHNRGTKRTPKRQILPDGGIPDYIRAALQRAARLAFLSRMGAR